MPVSRSNPLANPRLLSSAAAAAAPAVTIAAPIPTIANPEEEQRSVPTIQSKSMRAQRSSRPLVSLRSGRTDVRRGRSTPSETGGKDQTLVSIETGRHFRESIE